MKAVKTILLSIMFLLILPFHEAIGEEWVIVKSWNGSGERTNYGKIPDKKIVGYSPTA